MLLNELKKADEEPRVTCEADTKGAENRRKLLSLLPVSLFSTQPTCSCHCREEKSKAGQTDTREKKKNQCSKRIAGFIFTDDRAVCEKFEDEHSTEIP